MTLWIKKRGDCVPYDINAKESTKKYIKEKQHEIKIRYKIDEYEQRIRPAIEKSGIPMATFIKRAVDEKIERDELVMKINKDNGLG